MTLLILSIIRARCLGSALSAGARGQRVHARWARQGVPTGRRARGGAPEPRQTVTYPVTLAPTLPVDPDGRQQDWRRVPQGQKGAVFLSALKQAARDRFPAIGVGEDVRIASDTILSVAAWWSTEKSCISVAFPASAHAV